MIQLKRILLPTDFSEFSHEATKYACAFAEQFQAELHLLHIQESHISATPEFGMGLAVPTRSRESKEAAESALAKVLDPAWAQRHTVVQCAVEGAPPAEIVAYAKQHDIDMIVMGTHGRGGLAHALLGSVAEKVLRKAPCPVLTVRPEGHQFVTP